MINLMRLFLFHFFISNIFMLEHHDENNFFAIPLYEKLYRYTCTQLLIQDLHGFWKVLGQTSVDCAYSQIECIPSYSLVVVFNRSGVLQDRYSERGRIAIARSPWNSSRKVVISFRRTLTNLKFGLRASVIS